MLHYYCYYNMHFSIIISVVFAVIAVLSCLAFIIYVTYETIKRRHELKMTLSNISFNRDIIV